MPQSARLNLYAFVNNKSMDKCVFPFGNGVGVYENNKLCVSIVDQSGSKRVGGKVLKPHYKFFNFPIVRSFLYFFYGIYLYISAFLIGKNIDDRKEEDKNKTYKVASKLNITSGYMVLIASLIASFLFGLLVLGFLPHFIFKKAFTGEVDYFFKNFMIGTLRVAIIYVIFVALKFIPFMNGFYSFNGGGCLYLSERNKKEVMISRIYPLNFLNFLLNISIFSSFMVSLLSLKVFWLAQFFINVGVFFLAIIVCYEFLRFVTFSKLIWLKDITLLTNFLVCNKPKITHDEVLAVVKNEITNYDTFEDVDKERVSMSSIYAEMETKLKSYDKFEQSDIDWIIGNVLDKNRAEIKLCRSVSKKEYRDIMRSCERRAKGEPLSSIFGFVEFYGLRFDVNKKVLSPRMETEILVEEVLKKVKDIEGASVLDLCTGSGAIAICLAKFSNSKVTGVDISKQALQVAENNAKKLDAKLEFIASDLFNSLKKSKKYDIIVSNPPYIKSGDIEKLDIEVKKYDPRLALDGGEDGLDFYREIIKGSTKKLNKRGYLFFELGNGQRKKVEELMISEGFEDIEVVKDYNKIERIIYGRLSR